MSTDYSVCLCQCSEDEGRRMKRREKNRVAAQKSRKRQTQRADLLHEVGERISADQILIYALSLCVKHMALGPKVAHQKIYFWALNRFAKCCKYFLHCIFFPPWRFILQVTENRLCLWDWLSETLISSQPDDRPLTFTDLLLTITHRLKWGG